MWKPHTVAPGKRESSCKVTHQLSSDDPGRKTLMIEWIPHPPKRRRVLNNWEQSLGFWSVEPPLHRFNKDPELGHLESATHIFRFIFIRPQILFKSKNGGTRGAKKVQSGTCARPRAPISQDPVGLVDGRRAELAHEAEQLEPRVLPVDLRRSWTDSSGPNPSGWSQKMSRNCLLATKMVQPQQV